MSYFVDRPDFAKFLDPRVSFRVAMGRKGTGKSALLVKFAHDRRTEPAELRPVVLHVVPSDLLAIKTIKPPPPESSDPLLFENYWKQAICTAINIELARDIGFAWTDDKMAQVETAEVAGFQGRNLVGALLSRLLSKISVGPVELKPAPHVPENQAQLLKRIREQANQQRPVWFLLDDIDSRYQNTK